jgi:cell division protein FtsB
MAEQNNPPVKRKIIVRPAPALLKIAACLLIVFSMAALLALRWVHNGILEETRILTEQAAAAQAANAELTEKVGALGSVQSVKDIAREELDLVDPDTVVIHPN